MELLFTFIHSWAWRGTICPPNICQENSCRPDFDVMLAQQEWIEIGHAVGTLHATG